MTTHLRNIPMVALNFDADAAIEVTEADAPVAGESIAAVCHKVKLLARTGQPTDHWYWGKVAHDMTGFKADPKIPLDYCHDSNQIIGKGDKFTVDASGLTVEGELISLAAEDRAAEIFAKHQQGVPYQASINFGGDGILCEEIPANFVTEVNGYQFEGPGIVVREWPLRGVAICPYGQDGGTKVEFSAKAPMVGVKVFTGGTPKDPPPPEKKPETGADYLAAFGDQGGVWFAQGKTFAEAQLLHTAALLASVERLTAENTALTAKLAAPPRGEETPVSFSGEAEKKTVADDKFGGLTPNLARFAASLNLGNK